MRGYGKNQAEPGRRSANVRNSARSKTVISDAVGEVRIDVFRDGEGTSGPRIVKKRQRRLTDVDEIVLSLYAKGLTTGEISAHFAEICGASISRETVSRIAGKAAAEMQERASRPLDAVMWRWRGARNEFIPFPGCDTEIRKVICSTNAIGSLNARCRRAVRARGHFPSEQAALKCLYLVTRSLDPTGTGRTQWTMRWKPVIDAFAITFGDRWPAAETY